MLYRYVCACFFSVFSGNNNQREHRIRDALLRLSPYYSQQKLRKIWSISHEEELLQSFTLVTGSKPSQFFLFTSLNGSCSRGNDDAQYVLTCKTEKVETYSATSNSQFEFQNQGSSSVLTKKRTLPHHKRDVALSTQLF